MKRNKPDTYQSKEIKRIKTIDNDVKEGNSNDDKTNCGVSLDSSTDRVIKNEVDITRKHFIDAKKIEEKQLQQAPENVETAYRVMKPKKINDPLIEFSIVPVDILVTKTKPIGESNVQIQHLVNETLMLHDFGAELKTYKTRADDKHQYYRHIFTDVLPKSPAKEMKLRKKCEIVLLNSVFAPDLDHNEVLKLFKDVKVDGVTRFELVVRYVDKVKQKNTWVWFETSAVLDDRTPDHKRGHSYPTVEDERYEVLPGKQTEIKMICKLRIKGTKRFIVIGSDSVSFSLEPSTLRVNGRYKQDESGNVTFTATICDMDENNYIALSENIVTIMHTPYWFGMQQTGSYFVFRSDGKFLVYDMRRNMLSTSAKKTNKYCQFEKLL